MTLEPQKNVPNTSTSRRETKTNPLGDIRAEHDHEMLDRVFYETPDYRSILEEPKRRIVVGRRGTGKSAMFYKLQGHWSAEPRTLRIELTPEETDVIGLRPIIAIFGTKPSYLRAASKLAWRYALLQEILSELSDNYKVRSDSDLRNTVEFARVWRRGGKNITQRLLHSLHVKVDKDAPIEARISGLAHALELEALTELVEKGLSISRSKLRVMADKLDEGYEPDDIGIAILSGLVYAFETLSFSIAETATTVFLRDNIFRMIQLRDPDYSRNIEGDVLRLHWDEYHLFNMICNRIRVAFNLEIKENSLRTWNKVTARDLQGKEGFRYCLRLTLYRPRDLVGLLNSAFNHARSHGRITIVNEDVEASAREISSSRLDDLKKEYGEVIPGVERLVSVFASGETELSLDVIEALTASLPSSDGLSQAEVQSLTILKSPEDIVRSLYSLGFLGVWNADASSWVFSHDGKASDFSVDKSSRILIHPCYWIGLNLHEHSLAVSELQQIHDEYDIEVRSETPEIRKHRLGQFIEQLNALSEGDSDAAQFEDWCLNAIRIVFATGIVNAELHPNKNLTQRRDVVGRNTGNTETWKRILEDYGSRQVVFEAKNYSTDLGPTEYRQMLSYLTGEHGKMGFIINRSKEASLETGRELQWVREIYHEHDRRVIVKLPALLLAGWLSKLRNPQKHDAADRGLGSLLDTYERMYVRLGAPAKRSVKTKRRKSR
jgi:hypothetical protein